MNDDTYTPQATSAARKNGRGVAWSLVLLLGAFGAGLIGSPWFEAQVRSRLPAALGGGALPVTAASHFDDAKFAALEARLLAAEQKTGGAALPTDVDARIAALEAGRTVESAGAAAIATDLGPLGNRMTAAEERLKVLEPAVQTATTAAAQIGASEARISALQTAVAEQSARLKAFASLAPLRRAMAAGTPATAYVDALAAAVPAGSGDIALLRAAAARPITLEVLAKTFAQRRALTETTAGQAATKADDSWLGTAMAQAKTLISQGGGRQPATSDAIARAEAALKRQDVDAAVLAVRSATGASRDRFNDWLVDADRYTAARSALNRLETKLALSASAPVTPAGPLPATPNGAL
jgi:hypothetical protein